MNRVDETTAAMNTFIRWGKFNLVGAMGMVVQLAALALLNRWTAGHYMYASAAAIEIALLHNFMWHVHYTWSDRRDSAARLRQLVRFHLSNGLVSMLGNLALMRLLVHEARLPLLVSNPFGSLYLSRRGLSSSRTSTVMANRTLLNLSRARSGAQISLCNQFFSTTVPAMASIRPEYLLHRGHGPSPRAALRALSE